MMKRSTRDYTCHSEKTPGIDSFREDTPDREPAESQELFKALTERSLIGIYVVQDGVFKSINPVAASYAGYTAEEVIGKRADSIASRRHETGKKECPCDARRWSHSASGVPDRDQDGGGSVAQGDRNFDFVRRQEGNPRKFHGYHGGQTRRGDASRI